MKINRARFLIALAFMFEVGGFFGWSHWADKSPEECIASGVAFLLFSLSIESRQK